MRILMKIIAAICFAVAEFGFLQPQLIDPVTTFLCFLGSIIIVFKIVFGDAGDVYSYVQEELDEMNQDKKGG